jgi:hypothetical protein
LICLCWYVDLFYLIGKIDLCRYRCDVTWLCIRMKTVFVLMIYKWRVNRCIRKYTLRISKIVVAVDGLYLFSLLSTRWWLTIKKKHTYGYMKVSNFLFIFVSSDRVWGEVDILCWLVWKWRNGGNERARARKIMRAAKRNRWRRDINDRILCYKRGKRAIDTDTCLPASFASSVTLYWLEYKNDIDTISLTLDTKASHHKPSLSQWQTIYQILRRDKKKLTIIGRS